MAKVYLMLESRDITPASSAKGRVCAQCHKLHWRLWLVKRVMLKPFGHFPVVRLNGSEAVIDPSLPTELPYMPKDAVEITDDAEFARLWHDTRGSHVFG